MIYIPPEDIQDLVIDQFERLINSEIDSGQFRKKRKRLVLDKKDKEKLCKNWKKQPGCRGVSLERRELPGMPGFLADKRYYQGCVCLFHSQDKDTGFLGKGKFEK